MEQALMAVCKDIRLGKILIQTNHDTGEPEVCERRPMLSTPPQQFDHPDSKISAGVFHLKTSLSFSFTTSVCPKTSVRTTSS